MLIYITIHKVDDQCRLMHEAGHSKPVFWDNPKGWVGRQVAGASAWGDTGLPMADSC